MKSIIIYSTRYGSTFEAAKRINAEIGGNAEVVNVMTETVPNIDDYDTVILGGSVYVGRVQKQMTAFINANMNKLLSKKVGLFLCAGVQKDEEKEKELKSAFPGELYDHAAAKDVLGYAFNFEKMKFFDRIIMKKIKGDANSTSAYFDDRIVKFAKALSSK